MISTIATGTSGCRTSSITSRRNCSRFVHWFIFVSLDRLKDIDALLAAEDLILATASGLQGDWLRACSPAAKGLHQHSLPALTPANVNAARWQASSHSAIVNERSPPSLLARLEKR
ncbi:LOW QUALITY PROTEIN: hypothetical protein IFM46972_06002 [Aspergillus udagawae]|uniref:Uncharacterized protein n=1 Tax=Aspergillus udagawae TaxID=91492 RepID=A0A8H3P1B1_9EURO|nr:LOW QUALITY PROTEIN: hypothetical protein IFM46972_06002 [Aspergillus udagawae]